LTSKRIMKMSEGDSYVFYRLSCSCGDSEDDIDLELSHDDDIFEMVNIDMYGDFKWCYCNDPFHVRMWKRITGSLRLLFTGHVEMHHGLIIQGEDHINDFIVALEEGLDKIKQK